MGKTFKLFKFTMEVEGPSGKYIFCLQVGALFAGLIIALVGVIFGERLNHMCPSIIVPFGAFYSNIYIFLCCMINVVISAETIERKMTHEEIMHTMLITQLTIFLIPTLTGIPIACCSSASKSKK